MVHFITEEAFPGYNPWAGRAAFPPEGMSVMRWDGEGRLNGPYSIATQSDATDRATQVTISIPSPEGDVVHAVPVTELVLPDETLEFKSYRPNKKYYDEDSSGITFMPESALSTVPFTAQDIFSWEFATELTEERGLYLEVGKKPLGSIFGASVYAYGISILTSEEITDANALPVSDFSGFNISLDEQSSILLRIHKTLAFFRSLGLTVVFDPLSHEFLGWASPALRGVPADIVGLQVHNPSAEFHFTTIQGKPGPITSLPIAAA